MLSPGKEEGATVPSWWIQGNLGYVGLDLPKYRPKVKSSVSWNHFPNKLPTPSEVWRE